MARAVTLHHPRLRAIHAPTRWLGEVGRTIGGALDGLVIGLVVGYIAFSALGAPTAYLPLPWPVAMLLIGNVTAAVALAGALLAMALAAAIGWFGRRLLARGPIARRGRVTAAVAVPFRLIDGLPAGWLGAFAALLWIGLVGRMLGPLGLLAPPGVLSPYVYVVGIVGAVLGAAIAVLAVDRVDRPGPFRRLVGGSGVVLALAVLLAASALAVWPGSTAGLVAYDVAFDATTVPTSLADPGAPGSFAIERWSYGSGTDARRAAFAADVARVTPTVDAASILPTLDGGADAWREAFWGFGTDALPLNGLVWMPVGDGPFPLVLIVHGNHAMGDFSEPGYAYLGEHLASRGFITVSVDEDALNGSWAGDWGGREQLVRAWLLLLHLDQWRAWTADPTDPLYGRVDLDRVALAGHSRGGEAAAVAAMLATRAAAPDPDLTPWPTGLDVDAVIAIAPSDGQYGTTVVLQGVDLLTLSGGHDADARSFAGLRQYARTRLDATDFKAALWAYRANHGRFNTVWGSGDYGPFSGAALDLAPLLDAEAQQDVARTAIGAFLEASLHDEDGYRGFFRRPMTGRAWLPEDIVVVRSVEGGDHPLLVYGDRPVEGLTVDAEGALTATSRSIPLRAILPDQGLRGAVLRWPAGDAAAGWRVADVDHLGDVTGRASGIRLALADGRDAAEAAGAGPLALDLEVTTSDGVTVAIPLARYGALPPPLPVRLLKHDLLAAGLPFDLSLHPTSEIVPQTYLVPMTDLVTADPAFRPERLTSIAIRPADGQAGVLWLTELALAD